MLRDAARASAIPASRVAPPVHDDFRAGDVRHSQADIGKARRLLGYAPTHDVRAGLARGAAVVRGAIRSARSSRASRENADVRGAT